MKKLPAALLLLIALSACSSEPPPPVKVNYEITPRTQLDVLTVSVVDRAPPQLTDSPYKSNAFKPTIAAAIRQWAQDNLVAVGTTGEAIVVIKDASLVSQPLPHADDWFKRQQASKYVGRAAVEISISAGNAHKQVSAEASRYETLPEKPTEREKTNAYATMLNGLMNDLGVNLKTAIRDHLGEFTVNTQ